MSEQIFGTINENGGVDVNSGEIISAERTGTGKYKVTFKDQTFPHTPAVLATVHTDEMKADQSGTNRTISVTNITNNTLEFGIRVASEGNERSNRPFSFLALLS